MSNPRLRRLRWTFLVIAAGVVVMAWFEWRTYRRGSPAQYRPDEKNEDITSQLTRSLPPEAPRPRFTEVAGAAGLGDFRNFKGPRTSEMPEDIGPGLAWGDFDNDGDDDLFLVSAGGALNLPADQLEPCRLFENLGNGTFQEVKTFPDTRIHGNGAAFADYDGDGFLDLAVSGYNTLLLFHNEPDLNGRRKFVRDTRFPNPPGFWTGVAWGDFDNDRAPDLYVCGYIDYTVSEEDRAKSSSQAGSMVPFTLNPASFKPGINLLFHNNRDGTFTDVAPQLKMTNPEGRSLGALWHDFDNDGWLDLYVANDLSDNVLYHNCAGKFEDISHAAVVADYRSAMGLAVGDFDNDGDDDLFIAHWVAQENALYENLWADFNGKRTSSAREAMTPLRFMDIADMKGLGQIALPYVGWGTEFVDFDGDGWLDLVVANGSTLEEDGPMPKKLQRQDTLLFWNHHGAFFHNVAPLHPGLSQKHVSRGLAVSDYDNDGDMDFIIADLGEGVRLFRNEMQTGHWLKVRLHSLDFYGNETGYGDGSTVVLRIGGASLRRSVTGASYLSQSSRTLHFGLGTASKVDRLEVRWHAGTTNVFENLDVNSVYEFFESQSPPRKTAPAPVRGASLDGKAKVMEFWNKQHAAMDAMKVANENTRAITLFKEALRLNPQHEDSIYYLASCLVREGDVQQALDQLSTLKSINPRSQRAFTQWGLLRALDAHSPADLAAAEESLSQAHAVNPEETGALMALGEVALLRGDLDLAEQRLISVSRTNPKAAGAFFLRGYIAWRREDRDTAIQCLNDSRNALGKDWLPKGATAEGDVKKKHFNDKTPLARFWETWTGIADPDKSFAQIKAFLESVR